MQTAATHPYFLANAEAHRDTVASVFYLGLADVVVVVHFAYLALIPLGGFVVSRRPRLVWLHLAAVAAGALDVTVGFDCPLTTWEQTLRRRGGEKPYSGGFVDHYLTGKVYPHGYDRPIQLVVAATTLVAYSRIATRRWRSQMERSPR